MRRRVALGLLAVLPVTFVTADPAAAQTGPRIVILHSGWPERSLMTPKS